MILREFLYVSNILSLSRVALLIPLYFSLKAETTGGDYLAAAVMFGAAATDFIDGRLARKLAQMSDLGRVLDPIADKVCVVVTAFLLVDLRGLPIWYLGLLIARDLGILLVGFFLVTKTKVIVESNQLGKLAVTAVALALVVFILRLESIKWYFLWASVALLAVSTVSYLFRMVLLNKARKGPG